MATPKIQPLILFFIRRYNDIDHTTPIIHALSQRTDERILVLSLSPFVEIETDFRLTYLQNELGIPVDYAVRSCCPNFMHRLIMWAFSLCIRLPVSRIRNSARHRAYAFQNKHCELAWAVAMLDKLSPGIIIHDWHNPARSLMGPLHEAARKSGIPVIAVPHGVSYTLNDLRTSSMVEDNSMGDRSSFYRDVDFVVVQHHRYGQLFERMNIPGEKIVVLGSTRFCDQWREIYRNLLPRPQNVPPVEPGKLNIIYMDHADALLVDRGAVEKSLTRIAALDFVKLAIKPTTGIAGYRPFRSALLNNLAAEGEAENSVNLIENSDVVMGTVTSILLEALAAGKTLIYPQFHNGNRQLFDEMNACWRVDNDDELLAALDALRADRDTRPYADENVTSFLNEVVYGGVAERDVLGDHCDLIEGVFQKRITRQLDIPERSRLRAGEAG